MSTRSRTDRPTLRVDRVACTGHGVCATLLPGSIRLDEWGYPVVLTAAEDGVDDGDEARAAAVRWCPALALYADRSS
ncbi:ferredoxin [Phycicoccus sp. Root101]|uniref:ferredoxin n=1 Tax=Phycicoccus sp. Root101 TaxID=1736421 RepID=UPI0007031717|nr:ferredoxin [Phycicoccus sp. Root101]KQU69413.1 hypothetical protein ASC58_05915 [Phycicoccus sp. Root101]